MEDRTDKNQDKDKLTMGDWLAFLESRSSNYIAGIALMVGLIAIIAVVLLSLGKSPWMILLLIVVALSIVGLFDMAAGTSLAVDALEAKRISDEIVEGKHKTVKDVKKAWHDRTKGRVEWIKKKLE